jgi:hypothetical protein
MLATFTTALSNDDEGICCVAIMKKEYVGVTFKCCRVYTRIYINGKRDAYVGWCPRCGAKLEVEISPHGSKQKFFNVS